jgi:hypothetical protein
MFQSFELATASPSLTVGLPPSRPDHRRSDQRRH